MREDRARVLRWAAMTRRRHRAAGAVLRATVPLLPAAPRPERPIFILGSPRSGTTMLFQLLDRSRSVASLGYGSQFIWEMYRRREIAVGQSHAAGPDDITDRERRVVSWAIDRVAGDMPYLDKFPRMVLRAEYLAALYPDARFVSIVRDGRSVVSSLITGWNTEGKFGQGTALPVPLEVEGYSGRVWRFILPPGWEAYASGRTLAEVCAFQWAASNTALLDAYDRLGRERFCEVRYEELVAAPVDTTAAMLRDLDARGRRRCPRACRRTRPERHADGGHGAAAGEVARREPRRDREHPSADRAGHVTARLQPRLSPPAGSC